MDMRPQVLPVPAEASTRRVEPSSVSARSRRWSSVRGAFRPPVGFEVPARRFANGVALAFEEADRRGLGDPAEAIVRHGPCARIDDTGL